MAIKIDFGVPLLRPTVKTTKTIVYTYNEIMEQQTINKRTPKQHFVRAHVTVWDVDDPAQIANKLLYMLPEGKAKLTPIFDTADMMKIMMHQKK